ncbi:unnamed protein product [Danaus chrysippus]|uniref:(African queen) hypothetical protein n=1 Tax=Danaus chrysippus TaxID=151541 RepID=A0A8J2R7F3_9NEOP|nr:unnamed protein product [Danaus chrysippus]
MTSLVLLKSILLASVLQKNKKKKKLKSKKSFSTNKIDLKICRICNEEKGEIPIFNDCIQPNIPEEIKHFSGVSIFKTDNLPKQICQNCLDLLNGCIMFREMCQKTNQLMKRISSVQDITPHIKKEEDEKKDLIVDQNGSDESLNVPSPTCSEDNSEIWNCTSCKTEYDNLESYNKHLVECKTQNNDLKPDVDRKRTKETFLCDICGKVARSNANLLIHMAIHENIFPFKCDQCPYQGRTMDLLRVHRRTHMADKPFKCAHCPKSTTTSSNLMKHIRHVHSTTRPYKCTYCDKAFSYQHDMKRHIKDIHLRQGTVECDICFKKFNTKKILQGHRFKIHKIKGERHGRLPSYLQCQQHNDNKQDESESVVY